ncbi:class I SAM-dependent methyltransferase [Kribbella kalugense]|uniref:Methyltransferase family protein n=1 Tax=Kribbella kalugense TaxID=2512221 RepID=A0A4R7ZDH6_9ACTN|nr:class I SAM-dependent methyltransferase [Kribbella kalugense]TDW15627.1 methyltransferase family protein [Kribbella kalugense]
MVVRALSFGAVAEAYERFRPGYPVELFELVTGYAGEPIRTALEIGAGTGKATRLFAQGGIAVTATEPDAAMLAELRKHLPADVTTMQAAFEDLPLDTSYDLVYSAAALHWTNPEGRWDRMAALVRPGGVFASFGVPIQLADPAVQEAARVAREPYMGYDGVPSPDGTPADRPMQWPGTELEQTESFTDVRQATIEQRLTMTAHDFIGYLSTVSAYVMLPPTDRDHVFRRTLEALPETVEIDAQITTHLARRNH